MNLTNQKKLTPAAAFGTAFFLVIFVNVASAQTNASSQNGSMHMNGSAVQQQVQDPPAVCGANCETMAHSQESMSEGMMSGMMEGTDNHMSMGMMSGMMGDMHSDNPISFVEALGLSDDQIKKIEELEIAHAHLLVDVQSAIRKAELDVQAARMQSDDIRGLERALRQAAEAGIKLELIQVLQAAAINEVLTPDQRLKRSNLHGENGCDMASGDNGNSVDTAHSANHPPPVI